MHFTGNQYNRFSRLVCVLLGLWPYTYKRHRFRSLCVYIVLASGLICQLLPLTRSDIRADDAFAAFGIFTISVLFLTKLHTYYPNLEKIRYVFDYIEDDWKSFANEGELETITKYVKRGKVFNACIIGIFSTLLTLFVASPFVWMASTNQTQALLIPIPVEYFVDPDRYVLWILLHIDVQAILGLGTLVIFESSTIVFVSHLCGVFRIVSDRLHRTVESSVLNARNGNNFSSSVREQLIAALELHQRLLKLIEYLNNMFANHYFSLVFIGVTALSINLYVVVVLLSLKKITQTLFVSFMVFCTVLIYMCYDNYMGQKVIDKSNELFMNTYSTRWYESPLAMQKTLLFVRQRCMKCTTYISTIYFVASMECFFTLTNASMSFFLMLHSTMQRS